MATMIDHLNTILASIPEELAGSPKQVEWATRIADTMQDDIIRVIRQMARPLDGKPAYTNDQKMTALRRAKAILYHADATWYIDHRNMDVAYTLTDALNGEL